MLNINLYQCFNHLKQYNNIFLYSDPHFGDEEMQKKRGISDEEQIKRINSKVGRKDVLIILGDVGTNDPFKSKYVKDCIAKLRGYKILVMGNHDLGESNYIRNSKLEHLPVNEDLCVYKLNVNDNHLFDEVYSGTVSLNEKIELSHEPLVNLYGPMYLKYKVNIHGHDHAVSKEPKNSINVCAEAIDYTPVSLLAMLKDGEFAHVTSVHRQTIDKAIDRKQKRLNGGK